MTTKKLVLIGLLKINKKPFNKEYKLEYIVKNIKNALKKETILACS